MEAFEYRRARDSSEALALVADGPADAWLLAGGTDLLPLMKDQVIQPRRLVDIKRAADLDRHIRITDDGLIIGALATLADLAEHPAVREHAPLLQQAARSAATPQLREVATVAGNLLQRPRCWYYRNPGFHCWLAGGEHCHARDGRNERHAIFGYGASDPCCAVHPSDLAPCLVALGAEVRLRGRDGDETLLATVEDLFQPPSPDRRTETVQGGALLTQVRVPRPAPGTVTGFAKAGARRSWSFALGSVAARLTVQQGRITDAAVVLGGVANVPWRAASAEAALRGAPPAEDVCERAARLAVADAAPLTHNAYKVPLVRGLVAETLIRLARSAGAQ
jgi:xanthine dehydrogenase YagS FAD-binding subunit